MSQSAHPDRLSPFQKSLQDALATLESVRAYEQPLALAAKTVADCLIAGNKLLLCGNGGSAADSSHIATEFTCRFHADRRPYPAISLNVDGGLLTAIGNDYAFEDIFSRQVAAYGKPGDVLIVLTTSGKSRNVLAALKQAKQRKVKSIAFLGKDGGPAAGQADIELIIPGTNTARIQEAHKFLLHVLCEQVETVLPKE